MSVKTYTHNQGFKFENGASITQLEIAYQTFGNYIPGVSKVIWVCHALTANSDVFDWWAGLFDNDCLFNPNEYFIVCDNILGSHYGTTGPLSINPETKEAFFHSFPQFTIRDMVAVHEILRNHLQISEIELVIGSSIGGMQALEWTIFRPEVFKKLVFIASSAVHSPWGIAFNESQRMAIRNDATWSENQPNAGLEGMKTARSIALLSYRNYYTYQHSQTETEFGKTDNFKASSYQQYQGLKLANRFNAFSYWFLSKAMDSHNVGRNRESIADALDSVKAKTLCVGVKTDILFPPEEQIFVAQHIKNAVYVEIDSLYGHDGFLIETQKLSEILEKFISLKIC